ncbi:MAG: DUF4339 domain-containing protein [Verrucomicrobiales bacterium]|nr:DUF4339 domain-containing protein [Verrucomicrobiales bacterium]
MTTLSPPAVPSADNSELEDSYLFMTATEPVFSLLRKGSDQPSGPYSQEDILRFLQNNEIDRSDFVFYEGMEDWRPIDDVFEIQEQISHFVDDGQDKAMIGEAFREVSSVLATGEEIFYIALQAKSGLLSKSKDSVIITNKRMLVLTEKKKGYEMQSYPWTSVSNTLIRDDGKGIGTFSVLLQNDKRVDETHIPSPQMQRLFQLSQEFMDAGD